MENTFKDLSQLKKFRPAEPEPPPPAPERTPEDRQLAGATSSTDYFSSLLGPGSSTRQKEAPRRTTVVTPGTVARVRAEQAEDAFAAERESFEAELAEKQAVIDALALDAAEAKESLARAQEELKQAQEGLAQTGARADEELAKLKEELDQAKTALEAERSELKVDEAMLEEMDAKDREIARLQALLVEAQRTALSSTVLLDKPEGISEKFTGEVREHLLEALADAQRAADAGGRDRRARILEAILCANACSGELARRRDEVKQVMKDAGSFIDDATIAALERLGFRYVSGSNHHKLDYAGIRFPVAKTPSDHRSCLNRAAEICNRVF
ncbi:MAG: hypothetical protein IJJ84_02860 [Kiritimatiellae bacterium]|nr:hypothetical protein [Kiritimatiellia bacterium]